MTDHVLGLDLGLLHAGAAQLFQDGRIYTTRFTGDPLKADATIPERTARIRAVTAWAIRRATVSTALAVVEELPRGIGAHGGRDERAAVVWAVLGQLVRHDVPVALVNPSSLKAKIVGNGRADKDDMRAAVAKLYPGHGLARASYDECDAAALATLGVIRLAQHHGPGGPWEGPWLDARSISTDTGCQWPDLGPGWVKPKPAPLMPQFAVPS